MSKDSSAKYYQDNKERLQKKAHGRYQSLSKGEKEKKQQHDNERYKRLPKNEKEKLIKHKKKLQNEKKCLTYKKLFSPRKFAVLEKTWFFSSG